MTMPANPRHRRFQGFAALDQNGHLLWGTMRIRKEDAAAIFFQHNPAPEGFERTPKIIPVTVILEAGH